MQRREFITAFGESAAWPIVACAQPVTANPAKATTGTIHSVFATRGDLRNKLALAHELMPAANAVAFLAPVNTDVPPETVGLS
jgi:hypothetical protein